MNSRSHTVTFYSAVFYGLLLCYAMSFANRGGYFLVVMSLGYLLLNLPHIRVNQASIMLFLFSTVYFLTYFYYHGLTITISEGFNYLVAPWATYLMAQVIAARNPERYMPSVYILSLGFFLHGFLNIIQSQIDQSVMSHQVITVDFWTRQYTSATCQGMYLAAGVGLAAGLISSQTRKIWKLLGLLLAAIYMYNILLFSRRTGIFIMSILCIYCFIRLLSGSTISNRKKVMIVLVICVSILALTAAFLQNWFHIGTHVRNLTIYQRMTNKTQVNSESRFDIWVSFLAQCWKYPFGGAKVKLAYNASYVHNMWFDIYYQCGIIPFFAILVFTWGETKKFFRTTKLLRRYGYDTESNILNCIILTIFMSCMVEPVIEANPYFFLIGIYILGGVQAEVKTIKRVN